MNSKYKMTCKDIFHVVVFGGLVILNMIQHIKQNEFVSAGMIIEQTILIILSYVGLVDISSHIGWSIFVPDFFVVSQDQKRKEEVHSCLNEYFKNDINYIQDYDQERMNYLISQLGISVSQLDKICLDLIRMRCMPLKSLNDAKKKINFLVTGDYPIVINQEKIDSSKVCYNKVKYYINITDIMFSQDYAREISSILAFLITEKLDLKTIDKIIIPHDSNFLLGVEVGKCLGKSVVKMRAKKGKIEAEKCWEGNLSPSDKVIIVHDVLVTADQIIETLNRLPSTCSVSELYCLIVRKEWGGIETLEQKNITVHRIIDLDDNDIRSIRGDK